jgi:hypothetical protein
MSYIKNKRGRPPKTTNNISVNVGIVAPVIPTCDRELILCMKMIPDEINSDATPLNLSNEHVSHDNTSITETELEPEEDKSVEHCKKIIKQQSKMIENLRHQLKKNNTHSVYTSQLMKNVETTECNLKLINYYDNKPIIIEKTNIVCWWCTEPFATIPCFLPQSCNNNTYYVFGCFCSYNCAHTYNLNLNDQMTSNRTRLLYSFCRALYNKDDIKLITAPRREILTKFGGSLSIEQFRDEFIISNSLFSITIPPIVNIIPLITETPKI